MPLCWCWLSCMAIVLLLASPLAALDVLRDSAARYGGLFHRRRDMRRLLGCTLGILHGAGSRPAGAVAHSCGIGTTPAALTGGHSSGGSTPFLRYRAGAGCLGQSIGRRGSRTRGFSRHGGTGWAGIPAVSALKSRSSRMLPGSRSGVLLPACLHMAAAADGMACFSCGIGGRDLLLTGNVAHRAACTGHDETAVCCCRQRC